MSEGTTMDFEIKPLTFDEFIAGFMREDAAAATRDEAVAILARRAYDEGRYAGLQEAVEAWVSGVVPGWGDLTLSTVRASAVVSRQRRAAARAKAARS